MYKSLTQDFFWSTQDFFDQPRSFFLINPGFLLINPGFLFDQPRICDQPRIYLINSEFLINPGFFDQPRIFLINPGFVINQGFIWSTQNFWSTQDFFDQARIFLINSRFLFDQPKIFWSTQDFIFDQPRIFDQNFDFRLKFWFLTAIWNIIFNSRVQHRPKLKSPVVHLVHPEHQVQILPTFLTLLGRQPLRLHRRLPTIRLRRQLLQHLAGQIPPRRNRKFYLNLISPRFKMRRFCTDVSSQMATWNFNRDGTILLTKRENKKFEYEMVKQLHTIR